MGGGAVSYPCVASGRPAPSIVWFYNGEEVSDDGGVMVDLNDTLTIAEPLVNNSGIYQCFATNDFGVVTREWLLELREPGMQCARMVHACVCACVHACMCLFIMCACSCVHVLICLCVMCACDVM